MENITEANKRKFIAKTALFYGLILVGINFLGSQIPSIFSSNTINLEYMNKWKSFIAEKSFLINIFSIMCFIIPSVLCFMYIKSAKTNETLYRRIVDLPGVFATMGTLGWFCDFLVEIGFLIIFYKKNNGLFPIHQILISSFWFMAMEALFTFVMAYFILETLHRTVFLPRLFPEGNVAKIKGAIRPILWLMFIVFYIAVGFFPIVYLLSDGIIVRKNNGLEIQKNIIIVTSLLVLAGIIITIVFQKLFTIPIKELICGVENIKNGDYTKKVNIVSNDEFGILADTFNDMTKSLAEKEFMRDTFGKVVDPYVRDYLMKGNIALGGETREVSVMFCDIRSFTSMSENMEPETVVSLLNEYFTTLGKCISNNQGIINKYIGDAIMAIFGAPIESENHGLDAFNAAIEMRQELVLLNKRFEKKGLPQVRFGIGIHSGKVLVGNIGAENRMEYTVIGDTVNTASRIESLCKEYKTDLLVTSSTAQMLNERQKDLTFVDEANIRGKKERIKLYTIN